MCFTKWSRWRNWLTISMPNDCKVIRYIRTDRNVCARLVSGVIHEPQSVTSDIEYYGNGMVWEQWCDFTVTVSNVIVTCLSYHEWSLIEIDGNVMERCVNGAPIKETRSTSFPVMYDLAAPFYLFPVPDCLDERFRHCALFRELGNGRHYFSPDSKNGTNPICHGFVISWVLMVDH